MLRFSKNIENARKYHKGKYKDHKYYKSDALKNTEYLCPEKLLKTANRGEDLLQRMNIKKFLNK